MLLPARRAQAALVNDVTLLNPVRVARIAAPRDTGEIGELIAQWRGPISIGGGGFSMGGQIAARDSLHFDMRSLRKLIHLDAKNRIARVEAGMRWRDLQTLLDPHNLSVKIMQSYANFTVGGALSVNCHGRYVAAGPMINSVRAIKIVLTGGNALEASRLENPELFYGAIGGYGGIGVVTEVELDLAPNVRMERLVERTPLARYPEFFKEKVLSNPNAILHNANIDPYGSGGALSVTWAHTDKAVTVRERLVPENSSYIVENLETWALASLPGGHAARRFVIDPMRLTGNLLEWRNYEASLDVASLGPIADKWHTYALQEYFVPMARFEEFAKAMSRILTENNANVLNVSVRHSPADPGSLMRWAREDVFSFVLYYRQDTDINGVVGVGVWTRELIDAAVALGGTYYLPYQLHATREQFEKAYPDAGAFFALKARIDPMGQFKNLLWDKYGPA